MTGRIFRRKGMGYFKWGSKRRSGRRIYIYRGNTVIDYVLGDGSIKERWRDWK